MRKQTEKFRERVSDLRDGLGEWLCCDLFEHDRENNTNSKRVADLLNDAIDHMDAAEDAIAEIARGSTARAPVAGDRYTGRYSRHAVDRKLREIVISEMWAGRRQCSACTRKRPVNRYFCEEHERQMKRQLWDADLVDRTNLMADLYGYGQSFRRGTLTRYDMRIVYRYLAMLPRPAMRRIDHFLETIETQRSYQRAS